MQIFLKIDHVLVITTFNLDYEYILNCLNCISSLRFHNGLTHFLAFRDNQEKLNYRAIRQEILILIVLLTCIGTKIKRCTKIKGQCHSQ